MIKQCSHCRLHIRVTPDKLDEEVSVLCPGCTKLSKAQDKGIEIGRKMEREAILEALRDLEAYLHTQGSPVGSLTTALNTLIVHFETK